LVTVIAEAAESQAKFEYANPVNVTPVVAVTVCGEADPPLIDGDVLEGADAVQADPFHVATCPVVVPESPVTAPVPFPITIAFAVIVATPVPPFGTPRIEDPTATDDAKLIEPKDSAPPTPKNAVQCESGCTSTAIWNRLAGESVASGREPIGFG
jgi:hypothetical protein